MQNEAKERKERAAHVERVRDLEKYVPENKKVLAMIQSRLAGASTEEERNAIRRSKEFLKEFNEEIFGLGSTDFYGKGMEKYGDEREKALFQEYEAAHAALEAEGERALAAYKASLSPELKQDLIGLGETLEAFAERTSRFRESARNLPYPLTPESVETIDALIAEGKGLMEEDKMLRREPLPEHRAEYDEYTDNHPYGGDFDEVLEAYLKHKTEPSIERVIEQLEKMRAGLFGDF